MDEVEGLCRRIVGFALVTYFYKVGGREPPFILAPDSLPPPQHQIPAHHTTADLALIPTHVAITHTTTTTITTTTRRASLVTLFYLDLATPVANPYPNAHSPRLTARNNGRKCTV